LFQNVGGTQTIITFLGTEWRSKKKKDQNIDWLRRVERLTLNWRKELNPLIPIGRKGGVRKDPVLPEKSRHGEIGYFKRGILTHKNYIKKTWAKF